MGGLLADNVTAHFIRKVCVEFRMELVSSHASLGIKLKCVNLNLDHIRSMGIYSQYIQMIVGANRHFALKSNAERQPNQWQQY